LPRISHDTSNNFLSGIDETKLVEQYVNIFFKENSPYDEKTNKIWEKLSGFIIAKSVNEIKGKLKILIVQAKKNNKRANNKKEKRKNNKKINENENNIFEIKLIF